MFACARSAWNGGSTERAAFNPHIDFDCRIPARIQNFAAVNVANAAVSHTLLRGLEQVSPYEANSLPMCQAALASIRAGTFGSCFSICELKIEAENRTRRSSKTVRFRLAIWLRRA